MPKRGEIPITDSDGQTFVLRFGTNAIIKTQEQLNKPFGEILRSLNPDNFDLLTIRTMAHCAVIHPSGVTADQIGDLIDDVGMEVIANAIAKVFQQAGGNGGPPGGPSGDATASIVPLSASTPTDSTH